MQISCRPYEARARTNLRFLSRTTGEAPLVRILAPLRPVSCIGGLGSTGQQGCPSRSNNGR
jgi:hypothetical protein